MWLHVPFSQILTLKKFENEKIHRVIQVKENSVFTNNLLISFKSKINLIKMIFIYYYYK